MEKGILDEKIYRELSLSCLLLFSMNRTEVVHFSTRIHRVLDCYGVFKPFGIRA